MSEITIKAGAVDPFTGAKSRKGWTVTVPGAAEAYYEKLPDACAFAESHGASGGWVKSVVDGRTIMTATAVEVPNVAK